MYLWLNFAPYDMNQSSREVRVSVTAELFSIFQCHLSFAVFLYFILKPVFSLVAKGSGGRERWEVGDVPCPPDRRGPCQDRPSLYFLTVFPLYFSTQNVFLYFILKPCILACQRLWWQREMGGG